MIRALLVDDEQPTRDYLNELLQLHPDVEVVGEADDGETAVAKILELRPDLVFLDIQMPGSSGLEVADALPLPRPKIIFCTAYDQYAVQAFELAAVDYLLKPVNRGRLAKALDRVRQATPADWDAAVERVLHTTRRSPNRFLAKHSGRYRVIAKAEVLYFSIEDELTALHTADQRYWMDPTLADLEQRLDPEEFFRISRTVVVRLSAIAEVLPMVGGQGEAVLKTGQRLVVSRRRFKELLLALGGTD